MPETTRKSKRDRRQRDARNAMHYVLAQAALVSHRSPCREAWLLHSFRAALAFTEGSGPTN